MAGVDGDWDKLSKLLDVLATPEVAVRAAQKAAKAEVLDLYQKGFQAQVGPFGRPWGETPNRLIKSTALANPRIWATGNVVKLKPVRYWIFHQGGTKHMAEHELLPYGDGSSWDGPIAAIIKKAVERHFEAF